MEDLRNFHSDLISVAKNHRYTLKCLTVVNWFTMALLLFLIFQSCSVSKITGITTVAIDDQCLVNAGGEPIEASSKITIIPGTGGSGENNEWFYSPFLSKALHALIRICSCIVDASRVLGDFLLWCLAKLNDLITYLDIVFSCDDLVSIF